MVMGKPVAGNGNVDRIDVLHSTQSSKFPSINAPRSDDRFLDAPGERDARILLVETLGKSCLFDPVKHIMKPHALLVVAACFDEVVGVESAHRIREIRKEQSHFHVVRFWQSDFPAQNFLRLGKHFPALAGESKDRHCIFSDRILYLIRARMISAPDTLVKGEVA